MVSHFRHKVKPFFNFFFTFFSRHKLLTHRLFAWDKRVFGYLKGAAHEVISLTHRNRIAQNEEDVNTYFSSRKSLSIKDLARGAGAAGPKSLTVSNLRVKSFAVPTLTFQKGHRNPRPT